jgi:uncharacterized protein with FMN-binding domain
MSRHASLPTKTRRRRLALLASTGVGLGLLAAPFITAQAETSAPLPPDVDPTTVDVDVTSGTTVHVANAAMSLVTTSDKSVVTAGSTITYTYVLTNTGNTAFKNVRITDDKCEPVGAWVWTGNDADPLLNRGEAWTTTCKTTVVKDQTNKARVTATPVLSDIVVTPTATPSVSVSPTPTVAPSIPAASLKDGTWLGPLTQVSIPGENSNYQIQVQAIIAGGKITAVTTPVLNPTNGTSRFLAADAAPTLISEAIAAQSADVAVVAGATYTSQGFRTSLAAALAAAAA